MAGHGGHLCDALSDANGKGIHHSTGVAHAGAEGHNGHTHYCIEAHGHGDAGKYGTKGNHSSIRPMVEEAIPTMNMKMGMMATRACP